jgi:predicted TIM-barrel fold metal-dependent hydrolase
MSSRLVSQAASGRPSRRWLPDVVMHGVRRGNTATSSQWRKAPDRSVGWGAWSSLWEDAEFDSSRAGKTLRYSNYQTTRSRLAALAAAIS